MFGLALKNIFRHRMRTILTLLGVAAGMFLFASVETMQDSLHRATSQSADETTLIVYRENRYCPATSRLPEHYQDTIRKIEGVKEVIPVQIIVNNCGASLDVITFRGVPPEELARYNPALEVLEGSIEDWKKRSDAALLGEVFAKRRGLKPGDRFDAAGITVSIAAIIRSPEPQDNNVAYVHLPFLQQESRTGLGTVTQFNVRVTSAAMLQDVARQIDETFRSDAQATHTRPDSAFFAETASQLVELVGFTRWLGIGAVAAVLLLVANALMLIVRGRVKETAILATLGFTGRHLFLMVLLEGILLGVSGGLLGVGSAFAFLEWQSFTLGNEGITLAITPTVLILLRGIAVALGLGLLASLYPAWKATRQEIVTSLRTT
jgi:putative ABC transport system permease protein